MEPIYLSVKEAAAVWGINIKTIQTWINRRILVPEITAPPRNPRGHRLSIADVVVLGLLHSLFNIGVKFNDVPRLPAGSFSFDTRDFTESMEAAMHREAQRGRMIQVYLEGVDSQFQCFMHRVSQHSVIKGVATIHSHVRFFRSRDLPKVVDDLSGSTGLMGHFLVNVSAFHLYVMRRIGEVQ